MFVLLGVVLLSTIGSAAEVKKSEPESVVVEEEAWPLLQAADESTNKYRGVATLDYEGYKCTSFAIKPSACTSPTDKVIMMTNGHCTQALNANSVGGRRTANIKIKFGDFAGAKENEMVNAVGSKILYESMKQQDVAFVEMDMTYADLEKKRIPAYKLAQAVIPQEITTVGRPFEGMPDGQVFHRQAQCRLEKNVGLIEGDWHWPKAIATNCPSRRGASGSPMFNDKGEVVGILSTGSTQPGPGSPRCPANSPCEIGSDGKHHFVPHKTYGSETGQYNACFRGCKLDLDLSACKLAKHSAPEFKQRNSNMQVLKLDSPLPKPYTNAKYKMVPLGQNCSSTDGYQDLNISPSLGIFHDTKKKDPEGKYHLCILGGVQQSDGSIRWDETTKAYSKNVTIDRTPPEVDVKIVNQTLVVSMKNPVDLGEAGWGYKLVTNVKDCESTKGYTPQKGPPIRLPSDNKLLCLKAQDSAGNWQATPTVFNSKGAI